MDTQKNIVQYALMCGLYLGGGLIVFELVSYLTGVQSKSFFHMALTGTVWLVLFIWSIIYMGKDYRKNQLNNVMTYSSAYSLSALTIIFASLIIAVYAAVMYGIIDTNYIEESTKATMENMIIFYENMGADDTIIEAMEDKFDEQGIPTIGRTVSNSFLSNTIFGLIISLFTSIAVQRKEPLFNNDQA